MSWFMLAMGVIGGFCVGYGLSGIREFLRID